jgi:hypothetical protein
MKTCLNKDDSDGRPRKTEFAGHLEKLLQQYLQIHFPPSAHSSSPEPLITTVMFVQRFAASAGTGEFSSDLARLLGSQPIPKTALELVTDLADVFCQSAEGIESDLLKKAVQEALLMSIDVQADSSVSEFTDLLRGYLARHGNTALTKLFIGIHMFDSIWFEFMESDFVSTRSEDALDQLSTFLEQACFAKADAVIAGGLIDNVSKLAAK